MSKLDIDSFDPDVKEFVLGFIRVLSNRAEGNLNQHIELAKVAPHKMYEDQLFASPAVFTLLIYGKSGIDALFEWASKVRELRNWGTTDAQRALITAATGDGEWVLKCVDFINRYIEDNIANSIIKEIETVLNQTDIREYATTKLSELINFYLSDPVLRYELTNMSYMTSFISLDPNRSESLNMIWKIISEHTLKLNEALCSNFALLLETHNDERTFQEFFELHPALLDPLASRVITEKKLGEEWRTDFLIERLDGEYLLVELEKPNVNPFTEYPRQSKYLSHGIGQILNWFAWLEDNIDYAKRSGFPDLHAPDGLVIIGRDKLLSDKQRRFLMTLNDVIKPRLQVYTYDDILANSRNIASNLTRSF
ncbi:MAG: DUF4263 domain-containing protein [bacterium]|nr:DUF4263 domain-containing protein [bacterium]